MNTFLTIILTISLSAATAYGGYEAGRFQRGLEADRNQQVLKDSAIAAGCLKARLVEGKHGQIIKYKYEATEEMPIPLDDLLPPIPVRLKK